MTLLDMIRISTFLLSDLLSIAFKLAKDKKYRSVLETFLEFLE